MKQATKQQYDEVIFDDATMTYSDVTNERQIPRKRSRLKPLLMLCRIFLIIQVSQLFSLASGDYYQGYLNHIIRNQTSSACETSVPGYLFIRCPQMTTISIQGAMYGRKVPSTMMCPVYSSILSPAALIGIKENTNCEAETSLAKTVTVCQDKRVCQLLVHPREFGKDPCPDTSKYLTVTYKCRLKTESFRKRGSCRDASVRLRCPRGAASTPNVIAVYNVTITDNP
uniref:SUEL-type lectin domain-containing protein n=2 Tax=Ciona intestinalis TaxID=7719 RepID=F6RW25_CIOIN